MRFKDNFLLNYLKKAPVSLAVERSLECEILSKQEFVRPILDIGCGEGIFASVLFGEKIELGIDPSKSGIKRAKECGMYQEAIACCGSRIPKETASFNTILSNSALEHIPDIEPVLREANRLLSPQGRFYITVPAKLYDKYNIAYQLLAFLRLFGLAERYRLFFNKFWEHYHFYDCEGWIELFRKTGFKVIKSHEYCRKSTCLLDDAFIPFSFPSFLTKKIFNRWFLLERVREICAYFLYFIFKGIVQEKNIQKGGLIFFALEKETKNK